MILPGPESISKIHTTVLEIEGILFNILLFCKFAVHEIKALTKRRRKRGRYYGYSDATIPKANRTT
jgi:hypothetical protein